MSNVLNYCQQVAGKRLDQIDFADLFELLASRFQLEKITGYLFSEDKEMMSLFHDRYPQGGAVASESPKQLPTARFSWSHQILMSGEKVVVDDVNDMPVNAFAEQNLWRGIHIKSQLVLPLTSGQHTFGFISCSMLSHPIEWKAALINELNYVCQLIAPFIQNAAKQTMLRKTKNQLAVATQRLNQIARQDSLTGMANKARFDEVIDLEYRRLQRHQKTLTLYLIGVDFFDEYNEHYGHTAGAACLKTVGTIIQNSFQRAADLSAKIGDAQFAVVLPGVTENDALILANNLRDKILVANILHRASKITDRVTISVGIATCIPTTQAPPSHLVERATAALESAKEAGGDQADLAPPELEIEGQEEPLE
jgi:diguanylate cyclase (GGDEF)-like protein